MILAGLTIAGLAGCGHDTPSPHLPQSSPQGDGGVSSFYIADVPPRSHPGMVIRTEPLPPGSELQDAEAGERLLYESTDGLDGHSPIAVSGTLFIPRGAPPTGGWPLIAWAHGTVGIADVCAPSWGHRSGRDTAYLNTWLARGYAIVATDYQGLGTPGGHPYLDTRAEAYSVLDSIRAAQALREQISDKVVIVGQSQGAGAAFAAAGLAANYAPKLDVVGTVATGVPNFTPGDNPLRPGAADTTGTLLTYQIFSLYLAQRADPAFHLEQHVRPDALAVVRSAQNRCQHDVTRAVKAAHLTTGTTFAPDASTVLDPFFPLMGYQTLRITGPAFVGVGDNDDQVPPDVQRRLVSAACAAGSTIEMHIYPHQSHSDTVLASLGDSQPFVARAFAGAPIPGNCGEHF